MDARQVAREPARQVDVGDRAVLGGGPAEHTSEQQRQQLFAMSACMRSHGVSGSPGPVTSRTPPSNPQNYSIAEGAGDLWLLVPSTINPSSPAFIQAAKACKFH